MSDKRLNEEQIATKLAELISTVIDTTVDPTAREANLINHYGANSMDIVDIVMRIERVFGIRIENQSISSIETFGDVLDHILKESGA